MFGVWALVLLDMLSGYVRARVVSAVLVLSRSTVARFALARPIVNLARWGPLGLV